MKRIKYFFIRNYNLLFNRDNCVNIIFGNYHPQLGGIHTTKNIYLKYIGKNYFLILR